MARHPRRDPTFPDFPRSIESCELPRAREIFSRCYSCQARTVPRVFIVAERHVRRVSAISSGVCLASLA